METSAQRRQEVADYYGKRLASSKDLQTNACCISEVKLTRRQKQVLSKVHDDVLNRFYGCGSAVPVGVPPGAVVLDLGCGSGRDVYLASGLVGESGRVIGVDMTDEQLAVAREHVDYHAGVFGYSKPNVEFVKGYIEDLASAGVKDESVDIVISNCVVNLSPNKEMVLREIFRVLKPGGELYFSDVFADRRIPEDLRGDQVLWGECLSGALYLEDFRRLMEKVGFKDYRICESSVLQVDNPDIRRQLGDIAFVSNTVRAFKLDSLEDRCEDFGQTATYLGTADEQPHALFLDAGHAFVTDVKTPVCGNTADMLSKTRFAAHFKVTPRGQHRGLFGGSKIGGGASGSASSCGACC